MTQISVQFAPKAEIRLSARTREFGSARASSGCQNARKNRNSQAGQARRLRLSLILWVRLGCCFSLQLLLSTSLLFLAWIGSDWLVLAARLLHLLRLKTVGQILDTNKTCARK